MALTIEALDHIVLNVADVDASAAWYGRVLGMKRTDFVPAGGGPARAALVFGRQKINLRPFRADTEAWFTGRNVATGSGDLCFLTSASPADVVAHLEACGVPVELGPVERRGARGTLMSVYCRDPDGSLIEVASYPQG